MKVTEIKKAVNFPSLYFAYHMHAHTHTDFVLPMHRISDHWWYACLEKQTPEPYHCSTESKSQEVGTGNLHFNKLPRLYKPKFKMASKIIHKLLNAAALQPIFLKGKEPTTAISFEGII